MPPLAHSFRPPRGFLRRWFDDGRLAAAVLFSVVAVR